MSKMSRLLKDEKAPLQHEDDETVISRDYHHPFDVQDFLTREKGGNFLFALNLNEKGEVVKTNPHLRDDNFWEWKVVRA